MSPPASDGGPGGSRPADGNDAGDEFYVGYLPGVPAGMRRRTRLATLALLDVAFTAALVILLALEPLPAARFEFGQVRSFTGQLVEHPHPTLRVPRPVAGDGFSRWLLVGEFKHGAASEVAGLDGRWVTLDGTLVHRDDRTLLEVAAGSVHVLDGAPPQLAQAAAAATAAGSGSAQAAPGTVPPGAAAAAGPAAATDPAGAPLPLPAGPVTLRGEIVDSKCFLGVMSPGSTKVHRACAVRCISGGIPPVLLVRDGEGRATYLMLTGPDGRMVSAQVLPVVAEPVEITGTVERHDDLLVLRADPATIRRLTDG